MRRLLPGAFIQAVTDRRFLLLSLHTLPPCLRKEQVGKSGIAAVHNKIDIPVMPETVLILTDRYRLRPCFVVP